MGIAVGGGNESHRNEDFKRKCLASKPWFLACGISGFQVFRLWTDDKIHGLVCAACSVQRKIASKFIFKQDRSRSRCCSCYVRCSACFCTHTSSSSVDKAGLIRLTESLLARCRNFASPKQSVLSGGIKQMSMPPRETGHMDST